MLYIKTAEGWKPWLASYKVCSNSNKLEGVYRPEPIEEVRVKLKSRLARWSYEMNNGNTLMNPAFSGDSFKEPLFGAFGEKL